MRDFFGGLAKHFGYDTPAEMTVHAGIKVGVTLGKAVIGAAIDTAVDKIFDGSSDSQSRIIKKTEKVKNNDASDGVNTKVNNNHSVSSNANATHTSPNEHMVKGHGQHYNTKHGREWREKQPYSRGSKDENI